MTYGPSTVSGSDGSSGGSNSQGAPSSAPSSHYGSYGGSQGSSGHDPSKDVPATPTPPPPSPPAQPEQAPEDFLKQAETFGQGFGQREAQKAGEQATGFARASGLSPAQAALMASQQSGGAYSSGVSAGTGTGISGMLGKQGLDVQRYGIDKGVDTANADRNNQNNNALMNALGTGLSAAAMLFSDKNLKTDIKDGYGVLQAVTDQVSPKSFKYRGDSVTRQGIMAQDLEKTPLAYTVQDTPRGKMVDTAQLSAANTGMISELSKKLDSVVDFLKAGGK